MQTRILLQLLLLFWLVPLNALSTKDHIIPLVAGTGLALLGHNILEFISTTCHELGHAYANKSLTGDPIAIKVYMNRQISLLNPYEGVSIFKTGDVGKCKEAFRISAGPLAGIASTLCQLYLLNKVESTYKETEPLTAKQTFLQPFTLLRSLFKSSKEQSKALLHEKKEIPLTTFDVMLQMLKFFRCSRIIGEAIYGFTPMPVPRAIGDGQKLWGLLCTNYQPQAQRYPSNLLLLLTAGIMVSPIIAGCAQGASVR